MLFARSIKNVECGVQRPVHIPGHCFVGTRNKTCEFIAADASADTAFADGILQKLSDKADGTSSLLHARTGPLMIFKLLRFRIDGKQDVLRK